MKKCSNRRNYFKSLVGTRKRDDEETLSEGYLS